MSNRLCMSYRSPHGPELETCARDRDALQKDVLGIKNLDDAIHDSRAHFAIAVRECDAALDELRQRADEGNGGTAAECDLNNLKVRVLSFFVR